VKPPIHLPQEPLEETQEEGANYIFPVNYKYVLGTEAMHPSPS
jgi:hypothetical protein